MSQDYDVLVIGSGIAGLSFALKVAEAGKRVAIIAKKILLNRTQIMLREVLPQSRPKVMM